MKTTTTKNEVCTRKSANCFIVEGGGEVRAGLTAVGQLINAQSKFKYDIQANGKQ